MDTQQTVDDVRRCLHFNAMYIDEYIGRSVPDDELAEKVYCSLPCKQEAKERKLIIKTKGPNKETEEMTESIKSSIEAKIKASEEALAKSEKEQLQLKARVETLYEIYNNLRENAA